MDLAQLKYPIGQYEYNGINDKLKATWIEDIKIFPQKLSELTMPLSDEQLLWKYRPGGWTIRQVIHHCADSHMNAMLRFKLALTEDKPTIKPYFEARWSELSDVNQDITISIQILVPLHQKLVYLISSLADKDLLNEYYHPEYEKVFDLNYTIGMYAWHSRHHLAHVKQALDHKGEFNDE